MPSVRLLEMPLKKRINLLIRKMFILLRICYQLCDLNFSNILAACLIWTNVFVLLLKVTISFKIRSTTSFDSLFFSANFSTSSL